MTGKASAESDINVIVDYYAKSHFSLLDLVAVARIIEEHIGIKSDVMTRNGLHPVIKDVIERHEIRVF